VKLGEIESQLQRGHTTADRYSYLATAIVDVSTPAIHSGHSLIAKVGGASAPAAQGVQSAVPSALRCIIKLFIVADRRSKKMQGLLAGSVTKSCLCEIVLINVLSVLDEMLVNMWQKVHSKS